MKVRRSLGEVTAQQDMYAARFERAKCLGQVSAYRWLMSSESVSLVSECMSAELCGYVCVLRRSVVTFRIVVK